jgi:hypothetical protein
MRSFQCGQVRLIIRTPGQPNPNPKAKARAASSSGAASASSAAPHPVLPITAKHRPPVQPPAAGSGKSQFGVRPAFLPVIPQVFAKGQGPKGGSLPDPMPVGQLPRLHAAPDHQPDAEEGPEECLDEDQPDAVGQPDAVVQPDAVDQPDAEEALEDEPDNRESKRVRRNPAPAS